MSVSQPRRADMPTITTEYKGDMLFESMVGSHKVTTDVPESMGGKNRGLTPPQLFIISLGSCVGAFIAKYADQHSLNAAGMTVDVAFDKSEHPARLANIKVTVNLPETDCSEKCRQKALLKVAEHCPVHETIETIGKIDFNIVSA
jgi:uncharacterized OsmC-like protein